MSSDVDVLPGGSTQEASDRLLTSTRSDGINSSLYILILLLFITAYQISPQKLERRTPRGRSDKPSTFGRRSRRSPSRSDIFSHHTCSSSVFVRSSGAVSVCVILLALGENRPPPNLIEINPVFTMLNGSALLVSSHRSNSFRDNEPSGSSVILLSDRLTEAKRLPSVTQ